MALLFLTFNANAQEITNPGLKAITNHYAASRQFINGAIPRADIDAILLAGINAPSARNGQPWHFTVVQNHELGKKIISNLTEGNILIVISASGDGKTNTGDIFDCALAAENIYLAAQTLGYGSRIYTGPMNTINNNLKTDLGISRNHSAIALVRIGKVTPGVDAVSAASNRKKVDGMVTFK